jgi:hypothetical protein
MPIFPEWAELARSLGERKFVARHGGFFLLSTECAHAPAPEKLPTEGVVPKSKTNARRSFEVLPVAKSEDEEAGPITVGRARKCDLRFDDPSVSKLHAHLTISDGGLVLKDMKSLNGTLLNGQPVAAEENVKVAVQDRIHFGSVQTMVLDAHELYKLLTTMA